MQGLESSRFELSKPFSDIAVQQSVVLWPSHDSHDSFPIDAEERMFWKLFKQYLK